jgi:hypothetical protein
MGPVAAGALAVTVLVVLAQRGSPPGTDAAHASDPRPQRFRIVPDDYHVPYAGTAEDGRKFFLSQELFDLRGSSYVGLFLWKADGTFDRVEVDKVARPKGLPPGQAAPAGADDLVEARLAELGDYRRGPIEVEPFRTKVDGVTFGWHVGRYDDGEWFINVMPGDFICYYAPWDGIGYDT